MSSTYTQILYHIVWSTKIREPCLTADRRRELFKYIWGVIRNKGCHLYRIGGVEDHLHVLTGIHPTVCLAEFVKDLKISSSQWIKEEGIFPGFTHWQDGYSAFTLSIKEKDTLIEYIKGISREVRVVFVDEFKCRGADQFHSTFCGKAEAPDTCCQPFSLSLN